jgi:hypothetical protein
MKKPLDDSRGSRRHRLKTWSVEDSLESSVDYFHEQSRPLRPINTTKRDAHVKRPSENGGSGGLDPYETALSSLEHDRRSGCDLELERLRRLTVCSEASLRDHATPVARGLAELLLEE